MSGRYDTSYRLLRCKLSYLSLTWVANKTLYSAGHDISVTIKQVCKHLKTGYSVIEVAIVFRIDVQMTFIAPYRYAVLRFPRRFSGIMSFLGLHHKGWSASHSGNRQPYGVSWCFVLYTRCFRDQRVTWDTVVDVTLGFLWPCVRDFNLNAPLCINVYNADRTHRISSRTSLRIKGWHLPPFNS